MKNYKLKLGSISGIVLVVLMWVSMPYMGKEMSFEMSEILGYLSMVLALAPTIFVGIKSQRDKEGAGSITFGGGFKTGLLITLVASVIYTAGWITYLNTSDSDFMESYYEHSVEKLKNSDKTEEEINTKIAEMESFKELYKNTLVQIVATFLEIFPVGLLISLIAAAILRKKPQPAAT